MGPLASGRGEGATREALTEAFATGEAWLRKKGMDADADVFAKASTHWLRHTFGPHMLAGDVKLNVVQAVLGHQSVATTTIYTSRDGD